jgi:hypothetical protein
MAQNKKQDINTRKAPVLKISYPAKPLIRLI